MWRRKGQVHGMMGAPPANLLELERFNAVGVRRRCSTCSWRTGVPRT